MTSDLTLAMLLASIGSRLNRNLSLGLLVAGYHVSSDRDPNLPTHGRLRSVTFLQFPHFYLVTYFVLDHNNAREKAC